MQDQNNEQALDPVLTLPSVATFRLNDDAINAIEEGENWEIPQFENWDIKTYPSLRGVFIKSEIQTFPSKRNAGETEEVPTIFFCAVIKGERKFMYCASKQFVRLMLDLKNMVPAEKELIFSAKYDGLATGKKGFDYRKFTVGIIERKK